jgi:hypothetical protein
MAEQLDDPAGRTGLAPVVLAAAGAACLFTALVTVLHLLVPGLALYLVFAAAALLVALPVLAPMLPGFRSGGADPIDAALPLSTDEPTGDAREVARLRSAAREIKRAGAPLEWANAQLEIAEALRELATREMAKSGMAAHRSAAERAKQSVTAYRRALQEFRRDKQGGQWISAMLGLGAMLLLLAAQDQVPLHAEEAGAAFGEIIETDLLSEDQRAEAMRGMIEAEGLLRKFGGPANEENRDDPF